MANEWTIRGLRTVDEQEVTVAIAVVHDPELHDEWMADRFITVSVKSPEPIDWHFGDYMEYCGEVFSISYDPNVVKKARRGTYQEGFTYDNVRLYAFGNKAKQIDFKDVVLYDNNVTYTSLGTFSFFCASVEDLADRLQANFNRVSSGFSVLTPDRQRTEQRLGSVPSIWNDYYTGNDPAGETDVNIDIDKMKCCDVLKYVYEKFGLAYFIIGQYVIIGSKPIHLNTGAQNIFRYGKGLGLYEIERTSDENQEVVTKLFAYGSEKNLPLNYYANLGKQMITPGQRDRIDIIYGLKTQLPYDTCVKATNQGIGVTLKYGNLTVRAHCDSYVESEQKKVWWYFPNDQGGADEAFYNALGEGIHADIYVVGGADISLWPAAAIVTPTGYDYPAALSINKLMLPGFPDISLDEWVQAKVNAEQDEHGEWHTLYARYHFSTDSKDPWIESKNADTIGIFEGVVNFDGSQAKEIYPTIENTDAGVVTRGSQITDNGFVIDSETFLIEVADDVLDWKDAMEKAQEEVSISMTSGFCTGRDFKVDKAERNATDDGWVLTLERHLDNSLNRYFPYHDSYVSGYCQIRVGDTFVVTGIQMPKEYIDAAAEKLFIAACGYLDKRDHVRYTYLPKIDEIFMQREHDEHGTDSYHDRIRAGMKIEFEDSDLGIWQTPFIDNLTVKENGNNGIPTYEVVLRDEKEKGTLEKLTESITDLLANPPVQVVERQQRLLQYVEYAEWDENGLYYFETVNPDTDVLETSNVWHRGCLWQCRRTLTQQEPWFGNADWVCLRANNISLGFYTVGDDPMPIYGLSVRPASIDEYVQPYLLIGQEDISSIVTDWSWERNENATPADMYWSGQHSGAMARTLHLTTEDFPSGWDVQGGRVSFRCTATFQFDTDNAQISNQITVQ